MSDIVYSGCVIPARFPFIEAAFIYVAEKCSADTEMMGDSPCCMEPVGLRSLNYKAWSSVSSYINSKSDGKRMVVLCDGCALSLSESAEENDTKIQIIDQLEFLHENLEKIRANTVSPIDLDLAIFPGCHCESMLKKKGKDACRMMSDILEAIGVRPLTVKDNMCCGGSVSSIDDDLSKAILSESIDSFRSTGGKGVVTVCPFCFMQFDMVARYQTYHITELVAKALGWGADTSKYHRGKL